MLNAIGYLRVSTKEQAADDKFGLEAQRTAIESYAEEKGYRVIQWVEDEASGADDKRPGIQSIINEVYNPPIQAVIAYKGDRIARDTAFFFYVWYKLKEKNIEFLSVMDLDVDPSLAKLYMGILQFVAEQERHNIATRTKGGRRIKSMVGGYAGGRPPYGYRAVNGLLEIIPEEAKVVQIVFKERAEGTAILDIAEYLHDLGYKSRSGKRFWDSHIRNILKNEKFYQGYYKYGDMEDWIKGVHKPILK